MEEFHLFLNNVRKCQEERNDNVLKGILQGCRSNFQNLSATDCELALSIIFDENLGLLKFMYNELDEVQRRRMDSSIKEGFHLLVFIATEFKGPFKNYCVAAKEICHFALIGKYDLYIKRAACRFFQTLIKIYKSENLELEKNVKDFRKKFVLLGIKERSMVLAVLGTIAKHCPECIQEDDAKSIYKYLMADCTQTTKYSSPPPEVEFYLETWADMLDSCSPAERRSQEFKRRYKMLYPWIKNLSTSTEDRKRKHIMRKAIDLLIRHITFFQELIYQDYKYWHSTFLSLSTQTSANGDIGIKAIRAYYGMIGTILRHKNSDADKEIFLYFENDFMRSFDRNLNENELRQVVHGVSQLAASYKIHSTVEAVDKIYYLILRRTMFLYSRSNELTRFDDIPYYQEALSTIMCEMSTISVEQINALTKLCTLLVKQFAKLSITTQTFAVESLIGTIGRLENIPKNLYQQYLHNLIYDGLIWSCSHTILIDAELERDAKNLEELPLCYKHYWPLWKTLLNPLKYGTQYQLLQEVFDEMISCCVTIISKLDLNVKPKTDDVYSDDDFSKIAVNETDFRIFLNLVDLYVDIFEACRSLPHLIENWLNRFLRAIIKTSYRHPLVSGFYKLVRQAIKISDVFQDKDKLEAHQDTVMLVKEYLSEVLDLVCGFSEELQITCVYLILDAPITFVENILDRAPGILKIAFTTGLSNFSLASSALGTLTRWTNYFGNERIKNLLLRVVPHLEPFLCSRETSVEMLQDILKTQRKVVKKVTLVNEENTLENFQKNILIFLGSLDSDITLAFVHERSLNTGATWDKKNLLKYTLPYPDIKLDIYLDNGLSRIIELALHSADRRTKVVAAEVLHSVVAVVLDKTRQKSGQQLDNFATIYSTLLPTLLRLGCDSDDVVRQVFHPLMLQLTHWLGKEEMLCSSITRLLVDAIFDGIDDESNSSLKEFSGKCLAEFVEWSMMSTEKQFTKTFDNVIGILNKIMSLSLHPSARKRVAAAIAFNHLYRILREYSEIVDIFWLEILYSFIKSLVGCDDSRIGTALKHVERVLIAKANVFHKHNEERRISVEFGGSTLKDAADWLFLQCITTDRNCRNKCMELLEKISVHVPCYNSTKNVVSFYNNTNGVKALNSMILKNLNEKNYTVISLENLQSLLRALDCYIWLIGNDLLNFETLFATENGNGYVIFDCVQNFIHCLLHVRANNSDEVSVLSSELETLKVIKREIVIVVLKFVEILLIIINKHRAINVPPSFWSKDLFTLISFCVLEPHALEFNEKNLKITETLPRQVESLFSTMKKNNFIFDSLKDTISMAVVKKYQECFELDAIIKKNNAELNNSVRGLTLLRKSLLLDKIFEEQNIDASWPQRKLIVLFNALRTDSCNAPTCTILDPDTKEYFENLMQLLLITYDPALAKTLLNLILDKTPLENLDSTKIQHGYYFLLILKNPIFHHMLRNVEEIMKMLQDQLLYNNPAELLMILKEMMAFSLNHKKELRTYFEKLTKILLEMCPLLKKSINNLPSRKDMFLYIYITLVKLMQTPVIVARERTYLYEWILDELRCSDNLEYKTQLLENFAIGLIDAELDSNNELLNVLKVIKNTHLPQSTNDMSMNNAENLKIREYFDTLLKLLPALKSTKFFESAMLFAAGTGNVLCDEKITDSLTLFFQVVPMECALKSIDIAFRNFMDLDHQQVRMDILHSFLIPSFDRVKLEIIEEFFEKNVTEISVIISQSLAGCEIDMRRLILTKVGCYDLLGIMFTKLSDDKIESMKVDRTMLIMSAMKVRSFKTYSNENKELMRLLHCSAYNFCVARVTLKNDEKMYNLLFGENREKGQLIWENIIDCEKRYTFQQSFKDTLKKRRRHVNIRKKKEGANDHHARHSYLYSFDLASSTLTEDMNSYDYNDLSLKSSPDGNNAQERMSVTLESDDLNDHECMASICAVFRHLMSNGIFVPFNENDTSQSKQEMPEWLKNFYNAFTYSVRSKRQNVALFILKVILNVPEAFKPYAKFFLAPIITAINVCFRDYCMNDFITDAIVMLRNWKDVAIPTEGKEKLEAQKFLEAIIGVTEINPSNLCKFNMKIINILVESWNQCLTLPAKLNEKIESSPHVAVHLILIFVKNKMVESVVRQESILNHLQNSVGKWMENKEAAIRACESLGIVLNFMEDKVDYEDKKNSIVDNLSRIFRNIFQASKETVIKCIHALCIKYENAVVKYFHFIRSSVQKVDQTLKSKYLEVLLVLITKLTPENIYTELNHISFKYLLKIKISSCERVQLQIMSLLAKRLSPTNLIELAKLISPYAKHDLSQYREMTYEIFISIHNRFYRDISEDSDTSELLIFASKILLDGLMDPSEDLQKKLLEFWTEENSGNRKLTERCTDRLLEILNMYSPELEEVYLHILPLAMLQLTSKTPDFNTKICDPLEECQFIPYQIDVTCKTKNLASVAPLFANSHASQKNYSFAHSTQTLQDLSTYANSIPSMSIASDSKFAPQNALAFEPTIDEELDDFEVPEVTPVPEFKKPKELRDSLRASLYIQESSKIREDMRLREIKKNERHKEMIKMEKIRQRNTVKMTKEYTLGDYPDISITNSSLLQPLQKLATRDHNVCKYVIVSIFRSLIETMSGIKSTSEYRDKVSQSLKFILENCRKQNPLMATILEMTWSTNITDFCSDNVAKAAKSNQLLSLGALVLEEKLIKEDDYTGPPLKKQRNSVTHDDPHTNEWVQLASLYESMNEVDVVLSIFSDRVSRKSLQEATFARAANDWTTAKDAYLKAYEMESGSIKEHCLEGYYQCLAHLLCWKTMAKSIKQKLNNDYNNIWKPSWQEDWIVPWMFSAHVQLMLKGQRIDSSAESNSFEEALMEWMKDKNKCDHIKRCYGEEVAILLDEDNRAAQFDCLNGALEGIREQWIHLNPLSASQRIRLLLKLQGINEVHVYLKYSKEPDDFSKIRKLLNYWNHNVPSVHDDLITSSKLTTYRIHFAEVLGKKLATELDSQDENIQIELRNLCYKQKLKMTDAALYQKNLKIVKFHSYYTESHVEEVSDNLKDEFQMIIAKYNYLEGILKKTNSDKLNSYEKSWIQTEKLVKEYEKPHFKVLAAQHLATLADTLVNLSINDEIFYNDLKTKEHIVNAVSTECVASNDLIEKLHAYSLSYLRKSCNLANEKSIGPCYLKLSKYCHARITDPETDSRYQTGNPNDLIQEFVRSTLRAMSYGLQEAAYYFPCMLKKEYLENEETREIFIRESRDIQAWLFLAWQAQLLSHLGSSITPTIIPIIEKIVNTYPNAMVYTFRLTAETNPAILDDPLLFKIREILMGDRKIEHFLMAIEYLAQPELYLRDQLTTFLSNLKHGRDTALQTLLKKAFPRGSGDTDSPAQGSLYEHINVFREQIEKIRNYERHDAISQHVTTLQKRLRDALMNRESKNQKSPRFRRFLGESDEKQLKSYSPWLHEIPPGEIEIPGQYTGDRKPMPKYHAKIMRFESTVQIMSSLRRPMKVTMIGDDARNYYFLVKHGEDLRLDQRIQQLFAVMNNALKVDTACRQRQLVIDTYQVIPLSTSVGLIEWVDDTKRLCDFVDFTLDKKQQSQHKEALDRYTKWISKAAPNLHLTEQYKKALNKYSAEDVKAKMAELTNMCQVDSLRDTFKLLSSSPESFMALRHNFVTSYGTMCVAQWILGIGDRHLENTLISVKSGRSLGIDFGLAFGAGIALPIPELMPFRLTPQIVGLLKPFNENDLLECTMIHVMNALRQDRSPLLACMDVFVHEPLKWTEHVNKLNVEIGQSTIDVKWLPEKKIRTVMEKLNGGKSSLIVWKQLKDYHNDEYLARYEAILCGLDERHKRKRATMKDKNLSVKEQVECLLDQATDPNILGRSYAYWKPWL